MCIYGCVFTVGDEFVGSLKMQMGVYNKCRGGKTAGEEVRDGHPLSRHVQ